MIMVGTHTPSRRQQISQPALRSPLPRRGHCPQCFLAPRTRDTHRRLPLPARHQAFHADDRDLVCLALALLLSRRQAVGTGLVRRRAQVCVDQKEHMVTVEANKVGNRSFESRDGYRQKTVNRSPASGCSRKTQHTSLYWLICLPRNRREDRQLMQLPVLSNVHWQGGCNDDTEV